MKTILFLCTGNTCRSPMAEAVTNKMLCLTNKDSLYHAESAGLAATYGPASAPAIHVMKQIGIDLSTHQSRPISVSMLENAWKIYTMTEAQRQKLLAYYPKYKEKIRVFGGIDISDPYGKSEENYRDCLRQITISAQRLVKELA